MKDRIVIWGQDEKDEDILIAIRLLQDSDIIKIWTFPKKDINTEFVDHLFQEWKEGAEEQFPQPHQLIERGISEENMLPESIKTPKTDVIKIAEQEWRVRVLSFRLYQHIKQQIEQLDTRASNLSIFSKDVWEEAKDVSRSIKENTLDRNIKKRQTTELRNSLDAVFDKLKKLQNAEQEKFLEISKGHLGDFRQKISDVADQIGKGNTGKKLFDQLVRYQQEAKGVDMTIRDRNALRINFNEAFEALKASRQSNFGNRMNARVNGLKSAIGKMEASIKRDKDNVSYQSGRINKNNTTQLEYQLRSAKLKLIEDRIHSKEQKLHNMYLTLKDLEKKANKVTAKAQKGVLAATTNNKKAVVKTDKAVETKKEDPQNERATAESVKEGTANETTPAEAANVKEEAKAQVEKPNTPETEATATEQANTVEKHKEVEPAVEAPVEETKTVESGDEVNKTETTQSDAVVSSDEEVKKSDVAKPVEEIKVDETIVDNVADVKESVDKVEPTIDAVIEPKATENASDAEQSKTIEHKTEADAVEETKVSEEEPAVEANQIKEEVIETTESTKTDDSVTEEVKTDEPNSMANPVSEVADKLKEKAGATMAGLTASAAAVAGGLGLSASEKEEPSAPESLTDVPAVTDVKESVEAAIEDPTSAATKIVSDGLGLSADENDSAETTTPESLPDASKASEPKESIETTIEETTSIETKVTDESIQTTEEDSKETNNEKE